VYVCVCVCVGLALDVKGLCGVSVVRAGEAMETALSETAKDVSIGKLLIQTGLCMYVYVCVCVDSMIVVVFARLRIRSPTTVHA